MNPRQSAEFNAVKQAIQSNNSSLVIELIDTLMPENNKFLYEYDQHGASLLQLAIEHRLPNVAKRLFSESKNNNAFLFHRDDQDLNALAKAVIHEDIASIKKIIKIAKNLPKQSEFYQSWLHNNYGKTHTLLHLAAQFNQTSSALSLLLETTQGDTRHINQQTIDDDGDTALHIAAKRNMAEMCQLLLRFGARADILNNHNKTPFTDAAEDFLSEITIDASDPIYNLLNEDRKLIKDCLTELDNLCNNLKARPVVPMRNKVATGLIFALVCLMSPSWIMPIVNKLESLPLKKNESADDRSVTIVVCTVLPFIMLATITAFTLWRFGPHTKHETITASFWQDTIEKINDEIIEKLKELEARESAEASLSNDTLTYLPIESNKIRLLEDHLNALKTSLPIESAIQACEALYDDLKELRTAINRNQKPISLFWKPKQERDDVVVSINADEHTPLLGSSSSTSYM